MARPPETYRGARRNAWFGRKPVGNTKPKDRKRRIAKTTSAHFVSRQRDEWYRT